MATSFAAYASQYFTRQQNAAAAASNTMTDSHPMFFSFTTDGEGGSGFRGGVGSADLDDLGDPHFGGDHDQDPYLRLDEAKQPSIARPMSEPESPPASGWLAHLAASPEMPKGEVPVQMSRETSSRSSSSSSDDSSPPPDLVVGAPKGRAAQQPQPHSLSLTDSLLPRDGFNRPIDVFSLPDPRHTHRKRRKYHDSLWISIFFTLTTLCCFFSVVLLFTTRKPKKEKAVPSLMLPYTVLLRTVPMLVILTLLSALVAYVHVWLLKVFVKPVMLATSVFVPATLFVSAVCAFVGSFMWDGDVEPTWGESVGLRLFAIIPLVLSLITARRLLDLPRQIHTTSSTLTLASHLLINNPFLLALSPAILVLMLIASIPFVTLIFRLLLVGYFTKTSQATKFEWHVNAWANWAIFVAGCVWFWSWMVARGVLRMSCASVIGAWYFADPSTLATSTHTLHSALTRSTGPSLGTIILSSLILTLLRMLSLLALLFRRLPPLLLRVPWVPVSVPIALYVIPGIDWLVRWLERKSGALSRYALVYAGLTGDGFWISAVRARELVWGVESPGSEQDAQQEPVRTGRRSRDPVPTKAKFGSEPLLALLTISPLTLSFPFALLTYLFVAHTIGAPNEALGAALLAGGVTCVVGLFCVGVVRDTADTLYLCYCIDKAEGMKRREEVFIAFEYDFGRQQQQQQQRQQVQPILPVTAGARRQAAQAQTQRRNETLFDVDAANIEAGSAGAGTKKKGTLPLPVLQGTQGRKGQRTMPLLNSPFLEEEEGFGGAGATPTPRRAGAGAGRVDNKGQVGAAGAKLKPQVQEEDLEEDLDPFRRSLVDDEEAQVRTVVRVKAGPPGAGRADTPTGGGGMRTPTSAGGFGTIAKPSSVNFGASPGVVGGGGLGFGHRKTGSSGGAGGGAATVSVGGIQLQQKQQQQQQRMLTSTQELNMKSQFLMNMRAYGEESESVLEEQGHQDSKLEEMEVEMGGSGTQRSAVISLRKEKEDEDSLSEGEESQLGPGSDFFK